jgi:hypothetical protein
MLSARRFGQILTKFGISRQVFVEVPNIKFHKILSRVFRADTCEQTDRQMDGYDEANGRFSGLCNSA